MAAPGLYPRRGEQLRGTEEEPLSAVMEAYTEDDDDDGGVLDVHWDGDGVGVIDMYWDDDDDDDDGVIVACWDDDDDDGVMDVY
jgi:hypothetical protein